MCASGAGTNCTTTGLPGLARRPSYQSVGLSHTSGQVTHHIAPDIDVERDRLVAELREAGLAQSVDWNDDFHPEREGKNGGGDPWHTDGRLAIVTLR